MVVDNESDPEGTDKHEKVHPEDDFKVQLGLRKLVVNDLGNGVLYIELFVEATQNEFRYEFVVYFGRLGHFQGLTERLCVSIT